MVRTFAASCLILGIAGIVSAGDFDKGKAANWQHWRGPEANGSAPNADPPIRWDAKTNIKWKADLPGRGSATPIIWGNKIFVLTAVKDRQAKPEELPKPEPNFETKTTAPTNFYKFVVLCFDRDSGKRVWERVAAERVPHEGHHPTHSYAAGSPTTDGQHLFVSFGSFGTFCYDFDGNLKWSRDFGRMHTRLAWGEAVTPVIHGDALLLNYDQEGGASVLYCLDATTGKTRWAAKRDERTTWSTPLVTSFAGRTQVIMNGTTKIRSYDLATGDLLWECGGMTVNPIPSPVRFGDAAICVSGYRGSMALSVPLKSRGDLGIDGVINWRYASGTPYVPSPLLAGRELYLLQENNAILTILDAGTGKAILDRERLPQLKNVYASPIAASGRVYLADRSGTSVVFKTGGTAEVLSINKLDDEIDASPAAVGRQLFLRGEKFLYCIEAK